MIFFMDWLIGWRLAAYRPAKPAAAWVSGMSYFGTLVKEIWLSMVAASKGCQWNFWTIPGFLAWNQGVAAAWARVCQK
jgi:hypothetical protein